MDFQNAALNGKYKITKDDQEIIVPGFKGKLSEVHREDIIAAMIRRGSNLVAVKNEKSPPAAAGSSK